MNIKITAEHFDLTTAITEYVHKRFESFNKHIKHVADDKLVEVILRDETKHRTGDGFEVEVNIAVKGGLINASAKSGDLYSAIDMVKDEVIRELNQRQTKRRDHFRRGAAMAKDAIKGFVNYFKPRRKSE